MKKVIIIFLKSYYLGAKFLIVEFFRIVLKSSFAFTFLDLFLMEFAKNMNCEHVLSYLAVDKMC